jgi:hypothetical protein
MGEPRRRSFIVETIFTIVNQHPWDQHVNRAATNKAPETFAPAGHGNADILITS